MASYARTSRPARFQRRPELNIQVPVSVPSAQPAAVQRSTPKRNWLSKLSSFVLRLRPGPRSAGSGSSASTATTPTTTASASSSAFSRSSTAVTATWTNTSARQRVWPSSAVSLQHPPYVHQQLAALHPQDRTRHASLGAQFAPQPQSQPVALYSFPPGPTALTPSPYMLGRAASASVATVAASRSQSERESRGRKRGATVSQMPAAASTSQAASTSAASAAPRPSTAHAPSNSHSYSLHSHSSSTGMRNYPYSYSSPSSSEPNSHSSTPPHSHGRNRGRDRDRSLPTRAPIPAHHRTPSLPRAPSSMSSISGHAGPGRQPPPPVSYMQSHGWVSPDSSPSTIRRDSFDSSPSAWATPESQPGRRLSGGTCVSSGTFGV
ncbi:hypothetical protein EXIGLDRAFT_832909 [Exidia glandulosa HHB12029]|uniref:Uncharacterized protein n=1 Tax=Exidia glandulosa HHB12029 TaxID=1314781 RepID=A0A165L4M0_EXIGL|nr:hypothetical protein EXIGLDRAFT_832909 [Exidia glandulosa HHB12029]